MKLFFNSVIILFLCTSFTSAQEFYELYKNYLPEGHLKVLNRIIIDREIKTDAALDPSLIYLRINYYKNKIEKNDNNPVTNGLNQIKETSKKYYSEKNKWINKQIDILEIDTTLIHSYYSTVSLFLKNITLTDKSEYSFENNLSHDKNRDYFFQYLYLTRNAEAQYDSIIDYSAFYTQARERTSEAIKKQSLDFLKSYSENNSVLVNCILDNWSIMEQFKNQLPPITSLLAKNPSLIDKPVVENIYSIQVGINYVFNPNWTEVILGDFPDVINSMQIDKDHEIAQYNKTIVFSLQFKKKFYIGEYHSTFSYIKAGLGFSFNAMEFTPGKFMDMQTYEYISKNSDGKLIPHNYYFGNQYFAFDFKYGLFVNATLPLFYVTNNFIIEGGLTGGLTYGKYSFGLKYSHRYIDYFPSGNYEVKFQDDKTASQTKYIFHFPVSPVIILNYDLKNSNTADISIDLNSVSFHLGFLF